jgi:hypothetical protein
VNIFSEKREERSVTSGRLDNDFRVIESGLKVDEWVAKMARSDSAADFQRSMQHAFDVKVPLAERLQRMFRPPGPTHFSGLLD